MQLYRKYFKRTIDIIASGTALIVLSIPLAGITLWLTLANKGAGAFFRQERPGKNGKIFKIIKFKSMTDERDNEGNLLPDADRLTRVGSFVRSTSIDELPQLWNVFSGDMSLIGPRPLLPRYMPYYTKREQLRHTVRPGITGLAQVSGRNHLGWDDMLELDAQYVENLSFGKDLSIIFSTIKKVLSKKDIDVAPHGDFLDVERRKNKIS